MPIQMQRKLHSTSIFPNEEMPDFDLKVLSYVPEGTEITLLARTSDKARVKSWENYWYYVEVPDDEYGVMKKKAWMFGEFIKINK